MFCVEQDGGHSGGVNCVHWHPEDSLLYSGSDDTNIVEWDLQTGKTRRLVTSHFSNYSRVQLEGIKQAY